LNSVLKPITEQTWPEPTLDSRVSLMDVQKLEGHHYLVELGCLPVSQSVIANLVALALRRQSIAILAIRLPSHTLETLQQQVNFMGLKCL
jgi:hypothetical protein